MTVDTTPPRASRHVSLEPLGPEFADELYRLVSAGRLPWSWRGMSETPEGFAESLWSGVLVQYAVRDRRTGLDVGLATAYGANVFHRFAYVSYLLRPEHRMRVWPLEGALLFANLLFVRYDLRNLYAETADPHLDTFASGDGSFFEVEARLRDRLLVDGRPADLYLLRISRERWLERGVELLDRCLPRAPRPEPLGGLLDATPAPRPTRSTEPPRRTP